jgi:Fur family ferric uptake transcriptional regulator
MTYAPRSPRRAFGDIADVAAALREGGGRFSAPRRLVLEALFAADGPVSAEYIADGRGGQTPRLELTSVYRTLEHLEGLGVVRHVHIGHAPGLYALTGLGEQEYVACERCDRVTRVESVRLDPVRAYIRDVFGYDVRFSHFPMLGLCARCVERELPRRGDLDVASESRRGGDMSPDQHRRKQTHSHEHSHGDVVHDHPHSVHDHDHTEHEHEHAHGDRVHAHPHVHEKGLEQEHEHAH